MMLVTCATVIRPSRSGKRKLQRAFGSDSVLGIGSSALPDDRDRDPLRSTENLGSCKPAVECFLAIKLQSFL